MHVIPLFQTVQILRKQVIFASIQKSAGTRLLLFKSTARTQFCGLRYLAILQTEASIFAAEQWPGIC